MHIPASTQSHVWHQIWIYTRLHSFDKLFYIKSVLTTIKNPQAKIPVDQVHQVILNMLIAKYPGKKYLTI